MIAGERSGKALCDTRFLALASSRVGLVRIGRVTTLPRGLLESLLGLKINLCCQVRKRRCRAVICRPRCARPVARCARDFFPGMSGWPTARYRAPSWWSSNDYPE